MAGYLHGAYGQIQAVGSRVSEKSQSAVVYVGTAPVHTLENGAENVNVPVLVNNIAEARAKFGYSDDWTNYTLCEAMHVHFNLNGVGPLVLINVLDPATHKAGTVTTKSLTPSNGKITITDAQSVILDTVKVTVGSGQDASVKVKGTDYSIAYNIEKKQIVITELTSGALGTNAVSIEYYEVTPSAVTNANVIGSSDGAGMNTGLHAIKNVYQLTKYIPAFLACPGFSSIPEIHSAMYANSVKINGHWDAYMFADIPIVSNSTPVTLATAATWKAANGYTHDNETVFFPLAKGSDGNIYHLSVLAAANFQKLLLENDGIPYMTASNTECEIIENLYLGASVTGRVYDDSIINENLNKNGIASAAYMGGRWAIWGAHSAEYNQTDGNSVNVSETNCMMLFYLSNDFQARRTTNVDKPMTANDIKSIVAEEQSRLDALIKISALTYGTVTLNVSEQAKSDILQGDFSFCFDITTTPLAKSLTAIVTWTEDGFVTYLEGWGQAD